MEAPTHGLLIMAVFDIFQNVVISLPEQISNGFRGYKDDLSDHWSCCFSMFCASKLAQIGSHFGSFCFTIAFAESPKLVVFSTFQNLVISLPEQILDGFRVHKDKLSHNPNCFYYASCAMNLT